MIPTVVLYTDLVLRIVVSALLGGAIGLERVWHGRPAGLRTNMMIAISSCLFTILSLYGFPEGPGVDASRVASQIVVGVGFLGAGTVLHNSHHVLNLTTASTIWLVAAIGMAAGVGMYLLAGVVTLLAVISLSFFAPLSDWLSRHAEQHARRKGVKIVHEDFGVHFVAHPAHHRSRHHKEPLGESIAKD